MRGGARNKFLFRNLCFRPVVDVDGVLDPCKGNSSGGHGNAVDKKRRERKQRLVSENVADYDSQSRSWNRSLSRILKAVVFESALVCIYLVPWFLSFLDRHKTRRIRRRKSCNRKFHPALVTEQPSPGQVGGGINRQDAEEFETDDPPVLSSSLPSESKRTDCTGGEIVSGYGSETSGPVRRETNVQETGADKRQPRRLVTVALSLLSHRGIHVFLTVVGVTAAWGKTCAILFTSLWLYSIFFRRIAARRAYSSSSS